jgi:glutaredoxin 3
MNINKISKIKLYSTSTCPFCTMEAFWLDNKGIKYEKVLVDQNQQEAIDMVKKTGQMGVPVTAIKYENGEEQFIVGFDKPQLSQILEVS